MLETGSNAMLKEEEFQVLLAGLNYDKFDTNGIVENPTGNLKRTEVYINDLKGNSADTVRDDAQQENLENSEVLISDEKEQQTSEGDSAANNGVQQAFKKAFAEVEAGQHEATEPTEEHTDAPAEPNLNLSTDEIITDLRNYAASAIEWQNRSKLLLYRETAKVLKSAIDFLCQEAQPVVIYAIGQKSVILMDIHCQRQKTINVAIPFDMRMIEHLLKHVPELKKVPLPKDFNKLFYVGIIFAD